MLIKSYIRENTFTVLYCIYLKKSTFKWTCTVPICVVKGSTIILKREAETLSAPTLPHPIILLDIYFC